MVYDNYMADDSNNDDNNGGLLVEHCDHRTTSWVIDGVLDVAAFANQLLSKSAACKLCYQYTEQQVEFERRQQEITFSGGLDRLLRSKDSTRLEVDLYRQFLFDEESVVDSVHDRMRTTSGPPPPPPTRVDIQDAASRDDSDVVSLMTQRTS